MTGMRRLLAVISFLALAIYVSSTLQGQPGKKAAGTGTTAQTTPAKEVSQLAESGDSRFSAAGLINYLPVQGDSYFALQVQPKLDATPVRPRDILVMLSTTATQGGVSWIAGHQIAQGIIDGANDSDRISLWTVNSPELTKNLTNDFLSAKEYADGKRLRDALNKYRTNEFPAGTTDFKNALDKAITTFDSSKDRQRIILFLGDGLSTHNPLTEDQRLAIARQMVERKIAFFPVPLGINLNPTTLHGLANSTGGVVLRTSVAQEQLADALKRYEAAFAGSVLYGAELQLPAGVTGVCPAVLPPLRSDSPTLVVGRIKKTGKTFDYTVSGTLLGKRTTIERSETVLAPSLDNFFLVGMIEQWAKAKDYPAVLRADRQLASVFEQTRLQHLECIEGANEALASNKLEAADRLYKQARSLVPHDAQADAGIKIVDRLKDGTLNREKLRKELQKPRKGDQIKLVDGKPQWVKVDLAVVLQDDPKGEKKQPAVDPKQPALAPENLLKDHRDRQAIEEQKVTQLVDDAIRQAARNIKNAPDDALESLRNLRSRVKDHPDLSAQVREALTTRLQTELRNSAAQVQADKLRRKDQATAAAQAQANVVREQERKTFEERNISQFRIYRSLMNSARYEEKTKYDIINAMTQIQDEARQKGHAVPMAAKAQYDIALAQYPLQTHNTLIRQREEKWLSILMGIEKSHIPYPDEPPMHFPPLATWKALSKSRKDRFASINFPNADEKGSAEASALVRMLSQTVETKGFAQGEAIELKKAIDVLADKFGGKLSIIVDAASFMEAAEAPDPYVQKVWLPEVPARMSLGSALDIFAAQAGKGGTYIVNRDHILITTYKRVMEEKVQRIHPVGDLFTMPFQMSQMMGMMMGGGGMMGMSGGMMGMSGGMMGMGGMGGMGGMMGMGGGMGGMGGMMGMGGGMGGMGGMMGMGGGMGGMGGMMGMGGGMMGMGGGMGGMGGGMMGGGGGMDIMQANQLMQAIAMIVRPGSWNLAKSNQPGFMMGMGGGMFGMFGMMGGMGGFPGGGMMGMGGMGGLMMGGGMMGAPPDPNFSNTDPNPNSISYFPSAMAIVVYAPSRVHTTPISIMGGGRPKAAGPAGFLLPDPKGGFGLAQNNDRDPKIKVGAGQEGDKDPKNAANKPDPSDPNKMWNDVLAKGGVDAGQVVATAEFLFELGQFNHAAHFLKANLRAGVVVRPWVFEALAVALEMSGGDPEEIRRARLSGIALDPNDAQGYLSAAKAMADRGQHTHAVSFCKQASTLDPGDFQPYEIALAYAENAKDAKAMEWAVSNLVSQDWPVDNLFIQQKARKRLASLAATLKAEQRGDEATRLEAALKQLNQRDLHVELKWENVSGPCELEMTVKEPAGTFCTLEQKQSPGGGIMIGYNLTDEQPNSQYVAAQAFSGEYEFTVSRVYGQPLGNRARLIITQNAGTENQIRRIEIVRLDQNLPIKINLKDGRRTELASVSANIAQRREKAPQDTPTNAFNDLRAMANPNYGAAGPRGSAGTTGQLPSVSAMAARDSKNKADSTPVMQNAFNARGGMQVTTHVRLNTDQRGYEMVIRPFFDAANRSSRSVNLSGIPGGGN